MDLTLSIYLVLCEISIVLCASEYCPYLWDPWNSTCLHMTNGASELPYLANKRCSEEHGGHTLVIKNQEENDFFTSQFTRGVGDEELVMPLGCVKNSESDRWICKENEKVVGHWFNSTSFSGYWNWAPGQPILTVQGNDCLFLHRDGLWYNQMCDENLHMVETCVRKPVTTPVKCSKSWQPLGNRCVLLYANYSKPIEEVEQICIGQEGHPFVIDSKEENSYITGVVKTSNSSLIFIAGSNRGSPDGRWHLANRSPYFRYWLDNADYAGYWNWSKGEPAKDQGTKYVFLNSTGTWFADRITDKTRAMVACEQAPTTVNCPDGYEPWKERCLHVQSFNGSSNDGISTCGNLGQAKPTVIENMSDEFYFKTQIIKTNAKSMLLGCRDMYVAADGVWQWKCVRHPRNEWYWIDNEHNEGYWNWMPGEPKENNHTQCLVMNREGFFLAVSCDDEFEMLLACSHRAIEVVPTTSMTTEALTVSTNPTKTQPPTTSKTASITSSSKEPSTSTSPSSNGSTPTMPFTSSTPVVPHHQTQTLKPGVLILIIVGILVIFAIGGVFFYAHFHPSSRVGICLSHIFGRKRTGGGSGIPYERANAL